MGNATSTINFQAAIAYVTVAGRSSRSQKMCTVVCEKQINLSQNGCVCFLLYHAGLWMSKRSGTQLRTRRDPCFGIARFCDAL